MGYDKDGAKRKYDRHGGNSNRSERVTTAQPRRRKRAVDPSRPKNDPRPVSQRQGPERRSSTNTTQPRPETYQDRSDVNRRSIQGVKPLPIWVYVPIILGDNGLIILLVVTIISMVAGTFGIFWLIAAGYVVVNAFSNLGKARTLRNGRMTLGTMTRKEKTGKKVNKSHVYRVWFEYDLEDGRTLESSVATHKVSKVTDDAVEVLIYDKNMPERILAIDVLPLIVQSHVRGHFNMPKKR